MNKTEFKTISSALFNELTSTESLSISMHSEHTQFTRFNNSKIRQSGEVYQIDLELILQEDNKSSTVGGTVTSDNALEAGLEFLAELRTQLKGLPKDPNFVAFTNNGESESVNSGKILNLADSFEKITEPLEGVDFTGIYTSGKVAKANANNLGQFHYFETESFYIDYSLFTEDQQAVKGQYADTEWSSDKFKVEIQNSLSQLELLKTKKVKLEKGKYRAYLSPTALSEIMGLISWRGLGQKAFKTGQSSFAKLVTNEKSLNSKISIFEDFTGGLTPKFNEVGEVAPEKLAIVENGKIGTLLTSSRTAKEYNLESNNASAHEYARSMSIAGGSLEEENILKELGTGLYITNLWYTNYSDLLNCRITGMTRYACMWVEDGRLVAPIEHMRFDESIFDMLGENLVELTKDVKMIPNTSSYGDRGIGGNYFPGALVENFTLTL